MVSPREEVTASSPSEAYFSTRSRTASIESGGSTSARDARQVAALAPLSGDGRAIGVSRNIKRQFKDRRIYVNQRTGLPVRPPTSFGLFKHALRRSMSGNKVTFSDFNKRANEEWAKLREQDKELYAQRARELADQYKKIEVRFLRKKVREMLETGRHSGGRRAERDVGSRSSATQVASSRTTSSAAAGSRQQRQRPQSASMRQRRTH